MDTNDLSSGVAAAWRISRPRFLQVAPLLLVIGVAAFTAWPLATQRLLTHDHPVHLLKAWHFWNVLTIHGSFQTWSDLWAFGYPTCELTPCGEETWVALFRALSLGALSWEKTYRLAFAGMLIFSGVASYLFAKRYFGTFVGTLSAALVVLDPGALFQGGWQWHTDFGVWPITLSFACLAMAFANVEDVLSRPAPRHIVKAGGWLAAALFAHQLSLILLAFTLPLVLLDHWARGAKRPAAAWMRTIGAHAMGFGLASFSVVPLLARSHLTCDRGALGKSVEQLARQMVDLRVFENNWPLVTALGLFGAIRALRSRHPGGVFFTAACGVCFLVATDSIFTVLHLERVLPTLVKLESGRMVMAAKLFWFPLAAFGVGSLLRVDVSRFDSLSLARRLARWLVPAALMAPFAVPALERIYAAYVDKNLRAPGSDAVLQDYDAFNQWALAQRQRAIGHYSIAYQTPNLVVLQTMAPMLNQTPAYMIGGTPSQQFCAFPCALDPGLLETLSVKYVVADHRLPEPAYVHERSFGSLHVHRFTRYRKDRFTIIGQGHGQVVRFEPELIQIRLSGTGPDSKLKLHVAKYDRWEARLAHRRLPISIATAQGQEYPHLMEVPVADGVLELRYVRRWADWLGLLLSVATALAVGLFALAPRLWEARFSPTRFVVRHSSKVAWLALAALGVALLWAVNRAQDRAHMLPSESLFHRMDGGALSRGGGPCVKEGPLAYSCGGVPVQPTYTSGHWGSHLCMSAAETAPLRIHFATKLGSALQIRYDAFNEHGNVKVSIDGQALGTFAAKRSDIDYRFLHFDTRRFAEQNAVELDLELMGSPLRCFDVRIIP